MTVVVIMSILLMLLLPMVNTVRSSMEKASCMSNLKSIFLGAGAYVQDQRQWPQISANLVREDEEEYARQWIETLKPYSVLEAAWHCPTIERLQVPALKHAKNKPSRVDYVAMPFDAKPNTPYLWGRQPWFVERGDLHGNGNLMILNNGSIEELKEFMRGAGIGQ
jgi:hypothetical protein